MIIIPHSKLRDNRFDAMYEFWELDLLNEDVFLAGGAIRSLFDRQEPKDYDLFFRTFEAVPKVRETLEAAGYDLIFACPQEKLFTYQLTILPEDEGQEFRNIKVQLILENTGSPDAIIDDFDFNACRAAMDGTYVYIPEAFIREITSKQLSLHKLTFPVATIKRLAKYRQKGFYIDNAIKEIIITILNMGANGILFTDEELRAYID